MLNRAQESSNISQNRRRAASRVGVVRWCYWDATNYLRSRDKKPRIAAEQIKKVSVRPSVRPSATLHSQLECVLLDNRRSLIGGGGQKRSPGLIGRDLMGPLDRDEIELTSHVTGSSISPSLAMKNVLPFSTNSGGKVPSIYSVVRQKVTVLLSTILEWPAWAGYRQAEFFSQPGTNFFCTTL